ncbi:MAG TPA: CBS domain-containing protein [Gammaproteobacteria bacterium]|nr:CBS domain-containing protein [Gammaproteobacteria bacterium]
MSENKIIRVKDVMKKEFDVVNGLITVAEALRAMKHTETKTLLVDKRNSEDEFGMVLLSDIARKVLARDKSPDRVNIYEIMTKPVMTVDPEMDIRYCARMFDRFGLSRAPVIEDGLLIGIISFTDMVIKGILNSNNNTND